MKITYGTYSFTDAGSSQFSRQSRMQPEPRSGRPHVELVTWRVKELFQEPSWADNQARYAALRTALATVEGPLVIKDENDRTLFSETVRYNGGDLPEQWGQYTTEVTVEFTSLARPLTETGVDAVFTPSGSMTPIVLPRVQSWKESIRTDRYNTAASNRRETLVHISGAGRFTADPAQNEAQRKAAVLAVMSAIEGCEDAPDGTLAFGSTSQVVRVESIETDIGDGTEFCDWTLSAFYRRFPDGSYVEKEFEVDTKDNLEQSERVTSVRGKIRAYTEDAALSSANALRDTFAEIGRIQTVNETQSQKIEGADGEAFLEMSFTFEWREYTTRVAWTLTVATKKEAKSNSQVITRSGSARSGDASASLAKAQALGAVTDSGVLLSSSISFQSKGLDDDDQEYECAFSYEYTSRAGRVYAEVSNDSTDDSFSDNAQVISGFVVADTEASALTLARSFKLDSSSYLLKSARENKSIMNAGTGTSFDAADASKQFLKIDFTYTYYAAHTAGSIKLSVNDSRDYKARIRTLTYSGTAWAADESTAHALIDAAIGTPDGALTRHERRTDSEARATVNGFLSVTFTETYEGPFTATPGEGVLEAEYSIEATLSIDRTIVTPIPYGTPVAQNNVGITPAEISFTGFATGVTESACKTWGRARRTTLQGYPTTYGGGEKPPREKIGYAFHFEQPSEVRLYRFDFTYSAELVQMSSGI